MVDMSSVIQTKKTVFEKLEKGRYRHISGTVRKLESRRVEWYYFRVGSITVA